MRYFDEVLGIEERDFVAEVDRHAHVADERLAERRPVVIAVVVAVAEEREDRPGLCTSRRLFGRQPGKPTSLKASDRTRHADPP